MSDIYLSSFPESIQAGATTKVERVYSGYDDTWTAKLHIRGATVQDVTATWSGGAARFVIAATLPLVAGENAYQVTMTKSGEVFVVETGLVKTLPDFTSTVLVADARSHVKKCLDIIEAKLEGRLTADQEGFSIDGVSITNIPVEQLMQLRSRYAMLYQAELNAARVAAGLPNRNKWQVRFA